MGHSSTPRRPLTLCMFYRPEWIMPEFVQALAVDSEIDVRTLYRHASSAIPPYLTKRDLVQREALFFLRLLVSPSAYRADRFIGRAGHYASMLFARWLALLRHPRPVYLTNFFLHELGESRLVRAVLRVLMSKHVVVFAQTRGDAEYFAQFLPAENIVYAPHAQAESPFFGIDDTADDGYVFAGGSTNRDHDAILRIARALPETRFVLVASAHNRLTEPVPPNVSLALDVPKAEFDRLLSRAALLAVALASDTGSSGQTVLLGAMALGKPSVVPAIPAIAEYVLDGETGLLYEHDSDDGLTSAVRAVLDDPARAAAMGSAARLRYLERFTEASLFATVAGRLSADWAAAQASRPRARIPARR